MPRLTKVAEWQALRYTPVFSVGAFEIRLPVCGEVLICDQGWLYYASARVWYRTHPDLVK